MTIGVAKLRGADAYVIMPKKPHRGSLRWFDEEARALAERRLRQLAARIAESFDCEAVIDLPPASIPRRSNRSGGASRRGSGCGAGGRRQRDPTHCPVHGREDFSFMLNERPGHYIWYGRRCTGTTFRAGSHYPDYDFNDAAIPYGIGYWLALVEKLLPRARDLRNGDSPA